MDNRDLYVEKFKAQLDAVNARLDLLEAQAVNAKLDAQQEFQNKIAELKKERSDFENQIKQLQSNGSETWNELTEKLDKTRQSVEQDIKEALAEFSA
ncbi:MAG: hypothetical protein PVG63_06465 [Anaerolineales bacterium]|jgi:uncharacterized protein YPO0396